jgi:hypothetical protein
MGYLVGFAVTLAIMYTLTARFLTEVRRREGVREGRDGGEMEEEAQDGREGGKEGRRGETGRRKIRMEGGKEGGRGNLSFWAGKVSARPHPLSSSSG